MSSIEAMKAAIGRILILATFVFGAPRVVHAQGGPPMLTDDPDTPGPRYWEINVSAFLEKLPGVRLVQMPRLDLNYGVGRRIQLKYEVPWLRMMADGQPTVHAVGNSVAGVKWRFLGQEKERLSWSIYPQVEFRNGHAALDKGLENESLAFIMPTETTLELAHIEFNGEIGGVFLRDGTTGTISGLATEVGVRKRLELLAEIHGERMGSEPTEVILNLGTREKLTKKFILMAAVGRAVHGAEDRPTLIFYTGLQINAPSQFIFDKPKPPVPRGR